MDRVPLNSRNYGRHYTVSLFSWFHPSRSLPLYALALQETPEGDVRFLLQELLQSFQEGQGIYEYRCLFIW